MKIYNYLISAYGTRVLILGLDLALSLFAYYVSTQLRFNFDTPSSVVFQTPATLGLILFIRAICFKIFRTYSGIIRFSGEEDLKRVFFATLAGSSVLYFLGISGFFEGVFFLKNSILFMDLVLNIVFLTSIRVIMRSVNIYIRRDRQEKTKNPVVIFGAGHCGHITRRSIDADRDSNFRAVAVFDDNKQVDGKMMDGLHVYLASRDNFEKVVKKYGVKQAIIAIQRISPVRKRELANLCLEYNVTPLIVPPVENWINNKLHIQDIKHIKIEDLLHRDPIRLHLEKIKSELAGKVILVTGAAGSIGSEMVRQIINFEPHKLVVLDQAESPLVDLELEILENHPYANLYPVVADICDSVNLDRIFQEHRPQVVFHAAAYKHVPMMERHPEQAVKVNVLGTKNVADMSVAYKAEKFVMISTDKAVNPTNVMGASKRIAEIYIQALNDAISNSVTRFVTTRFGNVLGSNGSVVPRFKKQIEEGGPITVTHPDITRYFMTIPEACQLVLEAGTMGKGGEVFLFDMGEPVKIIDLAKKMIKLYGLKPYKDIKIEFTGLRPGEKLYEELLNNKENTLPTHHPKIMIAKVSTSSYDHVSSQFGQLVRALDQNDDFLLVEKMKQMVPEFISNCSKYEALDKQDAKAV